MTQYAVFIYDRELPTNPADIPPDIMKGHMELPDRIAELGGRVVAGLALEPADTATSIRGELITDGPFIETKEAMAGVYILEARDLDHALSCAKLTPIIAGGVEVRPLLGFEITEQS